MDSEYETLVFVIFLITIKNILKYHLINYLLNRINKS